MMDCLATFEQVSVEVRDACRSDFSFLHQLGHLRPRVLERRSGFVRPVKLIEIDAFDTQPAKRRFAFAPYGVGLEHTTWFFHTVVAIPDEAAFREHVRPFGPWQITQQATDNFFGMAQPVDRCRIDPVDAQFEGMSHGGEGVGIILRPPSKGPASASDRPGAKSNCCDIESAGTQRASR